MNECTNLGLISALMLTIVVPMSLDNVNDWLEEDFVGSGFAYLDGWLGQHEGENQVRSLGKATSWVVASNCFFSFSPRKLGKMKPILINIFQRGVQTGTLSH